MARVTAGQEGVTRGQGVCARFNNKTNTNREWLLSHIFQVVEGYHIDMGGSSILHLWDK